MKDCIFCNIVNGQIPSPRVYETEHIIVIRDISPKAPVHDLIIPKRHLTNFNELEDTELAGELLLGAAKVAQIEGLAENGYRLIINTGTDGGQLVPHLHLHLLGGRNLGPKIVAD